MLLKDIHQNRRLYTVLEKNSFFNPKHPEWDDPVFVELRKSAILQCREEFIDLCQFIETNKIRSYLEIGVWTGKLVSALNYIFLFDRVYACDTLKHGMPISLPPGSILFVGSSRSASFREWRKQIGKIDLTFVDGEHTKEAVEEDFKNNKDLSRFVAFHDISGWWEDQEGLKYFWKNLKGTKVEFIHSILGIGVWSKK